MKLSTFERVSLINQLEIRKAVTKSKEFDEAIAILENGYEIFYDNVLCLASDPMPIEDSRFVFDVLDLYTVIEIYKRDHPEDKELAKMAGAHFNGFDGNNEGAHLAFARFLFRQDKYSEQLAYEKQTDRFNSHMPMIGIYGRYLSKWRALGEEARYALTGEQIRTIISRDSG